MVGSFADAFGPACLRFFRPMRVVGWGGGSYFGFSFCGCQRQCLIALCTCFENDYLLVLVILAVLLVSAQLRGVVSLRGWLRQNLLTQPKQSGTNHGYCVSKIKGTSTPA